MCHTMPSARFQTCKLQRRLSKLVSLNYFKPMFNKQRRKYEKSSDNCRHKSWLCLEFENYASETARAKLYSAKNWISKKLQIICKVTLNLAFVFAEKKFAENAATGHSRAVTNSVGAQWQTRCGRVITMWTQGCAHSVPGIELIIYNI